MHILQAGVKTAEAKARIQASALYLADKFGVPAALVDALEVQERDKMVKPIKEAEAIAGFLEALCESALNKKRAVEKTAALEN